MATAKRNNQTQPSNFNSTNSKFPLGQYSSSTSPKTLEIRARYEASHATASTTSEAKPHSRS